MKPNPVRLHRHRPDFREMLSWPDADLQRVEHLTRRYEGAGATREQAARRAGTEVRAERLARRGTC